MDRRLTAALLATAFLLCGCGGSSSDTAAAVERQADAALALATIKAKMLAIDPNAAASVGVRVADGVATLRGPVRSAQTRDRIVAAARSVNGIRTVDAAGVSVDPNAPTIGGRASDAALTARVGAAVFTQTGSTAVRVSTSRGVVTLSGDVPDARVRRAALATARDTSGVRGVIDRMRG